MELDAVVSYVTLVGPIHVAEANGQVVISPAQKEAGAGVAAVDAGLVTGKNGLSHVVRCPRAELKGFWRELANGIQAPRAARAGCSPVSLVATLDGNHLVVDAGGTDLGDLSLAGWLHFPSSTSQFNVVELVYLSVDVLQDHFRCFSAICSLPLTSSMVKSTSSGISTTFNSANSPLALSPISSSS